MLKANAMEAHLLVLNLTAELAKLKTLQGLTPTTALAKGQGFAQLTPYRDSSVFAIKASGKTAWERHPDGEELVQVLEGTATFDIVAGDGPPQSIQVTAGMIAIVPQGVWHRARFSNGLTLISVTPQTEFLKLDIDDPRKA